MRSPVVVRGARLIFTGEYANNAEHPGSEAVMNTSSNDSAIATRLRSLLLDLARRLDDKACNELAATPYWAPCPTTAVGHRSAADALRAEAELLGEAS